MEEAQVRQKTEVGWTATKPMLGDIERLNAKTVQEVNETLGIFRSQKEVAKILKGKPITEILDNLNQDNIRGVRIGRGTSKTDGSRLDVFSIKVDTADMGKPPQPQIITLAVDGSTTELMHSIKKDGKEKILEMVFEGNGKVTYSKLA